MRFRLLPSAALLALIAIPATAQQRAQPQGGAAPYARRLQHLVGQSRGPVTLSRVHAEGNMLILTVNGGVGWRAFVPIAAITREQLIAQCRRPDVRGFFNGRRMLRIDTVEMGRNRWPGQPVSRCP